MGKGFILLKDSALDILRPKEAKAKTLQEALRQNQRICPRRRIDPRPAEEDERRRKQAFCTRLTLTARGREIAKKYL